MGAMGFIGFIGCIGVMGGSGCHRESAAFAVFKGSAPLSGGASRKDRMPP